MRRIVIALACESHSSSKTSAMNISELAVPVLALLRSTTLEAGQDLGIARGQRKKALTYFVRHDLGAFHVSRPECGDAGDIGPRKWGVSSEAGLSCNGCTG
jgi:hypothetical protein